MKSDMNIALRNMLQLLFCCWIMVTIVIVIMTNLKDSSNCDLMLIKCHISVLHNLVSQFYIIDLHPQDISICIMIDMCVVQAVHVYNIYMLYSIIALSK